MSGFIAGAVWNTKMQDRAMKVILASLGDNANDEGFAWPSVETICDRTMYGKVTVLERLARLESEGYLLKERHPEFYKRNAYRLNFDKLNFSPPKRSVKAKTQVQKMNPKSEPSRVQSRTQSGSLQNSLRFNPRGSQVQSTVPILGRTVNELSDELSVGTEAPPGPRIRELTVAMFQRLGVVTLAKTVQLAMAAVALLCRETQSTDVEAVALIEEQARATLSKGGAINGFWFEDSKWRAGESKPNPAMTGVFRPGRRWNGTVTTNETRQNSPERDDLKAGANAWRECRALLDSSAERGMADALAGITNVALHQGALLVRVKNEEDAALIHNVLYARDVLEKWPEQVESVKVSVAAPATGASQEAA